MSGSLCEGLLILKSGKIKLRLNVYEANSKESWARAIATFSADKLEAKTFVNFDNNGSSTKASYKWSGKKYN